MRLTETAAKRLPWTTFGVCCAFYVVDIAVPLIARERAGLGWGLGASATDVALGIMTFSFPMAGILVTRQQPRNRIGWLMLAVGLVIAFPGDAYVEYGLRINPGSVPGAEVVAALTAASWAPALGLIGTFLILLFPNGHLPSPRWRVVGWMSGATIAYVYLLITFIPGKLENGAATGLENPLGIKALGDVQDFLLPTTIVLPLCILMCAVALVQRFRRSQGVERLQLKWLASAGAIVAFLYLVAIAASLLLNTAQGGDPPWLRVVQNVAVFSFALIPVAIGVAILKHRLYGIDVVINKAVVFGTLASFITAVYVAIVVGIGSLVGRGDRPNLALSIAATAIVAVAFQPVRDRVQRLANRLVYGARATPYEVLSDFADRMGGTYDAADLLPRMARTVAQGVGATRVDVWLRIGANVVREASWPADPAEAAEHPTAPVDELADLPADRVVAVSHHGELLGAITVAKAAGEPITPAEDKLLDDVAAQAGLVLRNVRLIDELRSSRQRLVSAQDEERRRLERNLHDGAQQSLVSVALMLRMASGRLEADDDTVGATLDHASEQLGLAIDELRELARGIHPAILTDRGLGPALKSLAERSPVPVMVHYDLDHRPEKTVEGTLYFVVAEALTNVAKYADASEVTVTVARTDDQVTLEVADDGIGGADPRHGSGLRGLTDRVAAVDGTLDIHSPPGHGTRLSCRIPLGRTAQPHADPQPLTDSPRTAGADAVRDNTETPKPVGVSQ